MTATVSQLIPFNKEQLAVTKVYQTFLASHERNSSRTSEGYEARVREFFNLILKKPIEYLTIEDIDSIKHSDVQRYVSKLENKGNSNNTIKVKLYSVSSFYKSLLKDDMKVNPAVLGVELNVEEKHHEALSFNELEQLYDFMLNEEKEMGLVKYLFLKTLFTTGNRKTSTLSMTWKDSFIQRTDIETGKRVWVVSVVDKGKKIVEKPIPDEFYEELQQLNEGKEKVFNIASKTIERALERFSKKLGRNITIHSMKATGVTLGYQLTKDMNLCKQYASHEDISTTAIYLRDERSYVKQLSYNMSRRLDESKLLNMSRDELIEFLMDNKNKDIKNSILLRLE
ncbi:tyrosine-type recombinase/integrase [Peribacillus asahii]|uniref:tyrosine-type recombinase/integrase n=1 Tax=Peribacillus asahii TaxID=228899 RepID=UPI0037F3470F